MTPFRRAAEVLQDAIAIARLPRRGGRSRARAKPSSGGSAFGALTYDEGAPETTHRHHLRSRVPDQGHRHRDPGDARRGRWHACDSRTRSAHVDSRVARRRSRRRDRCAICWPTVRGSDRLPAVSSATSPGAPSSSPRSPDRRSSTRRGPGDLLRPRLHAARVHPGGCAGAARPVDRPARSIPSASLDCPVPSRRLAT